MTKFNFKRGSATPKGKIKALRLITKDYSIYFNKYGMKRSIEEVKKSLNNKKE